MESSAEPYACSECDAHVPVDAGADLMVLLHGRGGHVEQVVTADDLEVHRCRLPGREAGT
jgi:hypothetical protein